MQKLLVASIRNNLLPSVNKFIPFYIKTGGRIMKSLLYKIYSSFQLSCVLNSLLTVQQMPYCCCFVPATLPCGVCCTTCWETSQPYRTSRKMGTSWINICLKITLFYHFFSLYSGYSTSVNRTRTKWNLLQHFNFHWHQDLFRPRIRIYITAVSPSSQNSHGDHYFIPLGVPIILRIF